MKLSVLDMPVWTLTDANKFPLYRDALEKGTRFGVGGEYKRPQAARRDGRGLDASAASRAKTRTRPGGSSAPAARATTSSSSACSRSRPTRPDLGLEAGEYVALLSHSGSRGTGASVCSTYSAIAQARMPKRFERLGRLAWLDMDTQEGQEYWAAMNLMGDYAAANHAVIHRNVAKLLGAEVIAGVENHHNFAWKERHGGEEVFVHRKGATPAGRGVLGVIPGSMGDPGVRRPRAGQPREPELGLARRGAADVAQGGQGQVQLSRGAEGPGRNAASKCSPPAPTKSPASTRTSTP